MDGSMSMSSPGVPEAMALGGGWTGVALYRLMRGVMLIAMTYPSSVPLLSLYHRSLQGTSTTKRWLPMSASMGSYALVWSLTGLVPLAVNAVGPIATLANGHGAALFGGSLVLLGAYRDSPYKDRCRRYCRSPMCFLMTHGYGDIGGAARAAAEFGVFRVGCCWALFAFLVVVGSMNIP